MLEGLHDLESEVKTLIGIAKFKEQTTVDSLPADGAASIKPTTTEGDKADPGEQAKKWAKDVLKGVGEVAGAAPAGPSRA